MKPLRVIVAPNSFKGSLSTFKLCKIISKQLERYGIDSLSLPMGDGGDGSAEVIGYYMNASAIQVETTDALGRERLSSYYVTDNIAIIDLAESCGIKHLKRNELNTMQANSAGFGRVINDALKRGYRKLILCLGGSATVDGGTGALSELGLHIKKRSNNFRNAVVELEDIEVKELQNNFSGVDITILCDVETPICGDNGAATIFAPQKGASEEEVTLLDRSLYRLTEILEKESGKKLYSMRYGGAAGGVALSFHALLNAQLVSGSNFCLSLSKFEQHLKNIDAVITGEGRVDTQTLYGKLPGVVATHAKKHNIPIYIVAGIIDKAVIDKFDTVFSIMDYASSLEESFRYAEEYIKIITEILAERLFEQRASIS